MSPNYFEALLHHHSWAVKRLLDKAALATSAELGADTLGQGSILASLQHLADADQSWGRVAQGIQILDLEEMTSKCVDLSSLRAFWLPGSNRLIDFIKSLAPDDFEREVQPPWRRQPSKIWQILLHITNHRAEHGNQIGWQLTELGHSPGEMGFMEFVDFQHSG